MNNTDTLIVAMTGASGACYGLRLLEILLKSHKKVYLMVSQPGQMVINMETELSVPGRPAEMAEYLGSRYGAQPGQLTVFGKDQWTAAIASGGHRAYAMVVCPCTTGSLANIAQGSSRNLIERAADVMIKEKRQLIMVVRETPLSAIHLNHMLILSQMGVTIMPANPGFYLQPKSIADLVDFIVARILDHLEVTHTLLPRWGESNH